MVTGGGREMREGRNQMGSRGRTSLSFLCTAGQYLSSKDTRRINIKNCPKCLYLDMAGLPRNRITSFSDMLYCVQVSYGMPCMCSNTASQF